MGPGNQGRVSLLFVRALAGIQTGVLGGLAMMSWLAASSALDRQSIWTIPNLLGSVLSGRDVLRRGFGAVTVAGLALHLCVAGVIGSAFGLLVGESRNRLRVALLGILAGLSWYYVSELLFWKKLGALVLIYSPQRPMLLGHLIYGFVLAWHPRGLRGVLSGFQGGPPTHPPAIG